MDKEGRVEEIRAERRGRRLDCVYCGNNTYVEVVNGRDACSFCGAGIDDDIIEIEDCESVITEKPSYDMRVVEKTKGGALVVETVRNMTRYHSRRKPKGFNKYLVKNPFITAMALFFLFLFVAPYVFNIVDTVPYQKQIETVEIRNQVPVSFRVDLIDGYTGEFKDYQALIEIYTSDIELVYVLKLKNSATFSLVLEEDEVYKVWIYPYLNSTRFEDSFMVTADERYLLIFPVY